MAITIQSQSDDTSTAIPVTPQTIDFESSTSIDIQTVEIQDDSSIIITTNSESVISIETSPQISLPLIKALHIEDATNTIDVITRVNAILVVLENLGFIAVE